MSPDPLSQDQTFHLEGILSSKMDEVVDRIKRDFGSNEVLILVCRGSRRHVVAKKLEQKLSQQLFHCDKQFARATHLIRLKSFA